ncbi:unnamed protein product [Rotaria sp. Silwood2]|nr:unnamed protein product [Rotaria sp. Silwood2]CAF3056098.1 unnamed protein product [Rotaria sp. Silwood2]CAF4576564.1 unnamed protein product [Rotaria sp. Silwood2]CAF4658812.1 unnamed protein product [Rotaria sp. Silwood2]
MCSSSILISRGIHNLTLWSSIHFNEVSPCILTLPCLNDQYLTGDDFDFPEICQEISIKHLRDSSITRFRMLDEINTLITLKMNEDNGSIEYPNGLIWDEASESIDEIKKMILNQQE